MKPNFLALALCLSSLLLSAVARGQASSSSVGPDGFFRYNGQKFFPVGYYSGPSLPAKDLPAATQAMHDAGFNWFMASGNSLESTGTFLNQAQSLGLKVSLAGAGYNSEGDYRAIVNAFKNYPAIFSWETADDAGYVPIKSFPARIRRYHELAKAADPNHLTFVEGIASLLDNADSTRIYTGIADYAALEWYPLFYKPGRRGYAYLDRATHNAVSRWRTAAQQQGKAGVAILQTYWKADNAGDPSYESPAGEQLRAQSYAAVLAGAKGVTYYSYYDERSNGPIDVKQPGLWQATADFATKMKNTLAAVVLNGTQTTLTEQNNTPYVHAAYWTYHGQQYLLVVNLNTDNVTDSGSRTVSFATGLTGGMANLFSDYSATLTKTASGTVSGPVPALGVQVYRITPSTSPPSPTVTPSAASVAAGSTFQVRVANGPANAGDWVGLYAPGAADNAYGAAQYLNGNPDTPPAAGLRSATLTFTAPAAVGSYELRLFANDSYTRLATAPLTITAAGPVADGVYTLTARHSGKLLDVAGASQQDTARVVQWPATGGLNQQWQLTATGNGYYKLTARHSGKVLDVNDGSSADGAKVQQYRNNDSPAQRWKIEATSDGYYKLTNQASGKALDVAEVSTKNGVRVHQWAYAGGLNQQWKLEPVAASTRQTAAVPAATTTPSALAAHSLHVYPNPNRGQGTLVLEAKEAQHVTVYMHDGQGQLVSVLTVLAHAGRTDFPLPAALAPGTYHVRAVVDGRKHQFVLKVE